MRDPLCFILIKLHFPSTSNMRRIVFLPFYI